MTVRQQIRSFLQDPQQFAMGAPDPKVWTNALENFVNPSIADHGDHALRPAQLAAWEGLSTARAGLLLGPPGTGKTHLLSWMILGYIHARKAAGLPCRVFVSAFTRNAIGNLLDAIASRKNTHWSDGPKVCYFGNAPGGGLAAGILHQSRLDGANLDAALEFINDNEHAIVGGSIWSLYRLLDSGAAQGADGLTAEIFDLVCIDEASQMVLGHGLLAIGGLKTNGRLVVAGDDRQLPPIRATREVALGERQLGGSLYSFLKSGSVPEFALEETFRLNAPLAVFPERKFYPGQYHSTVPSNRLQMVETWQEGLTDWEKKVLDPEWPVCVLLHDGPPSATTNVLETELAVSLGVKLADRMIGAKSSNGDVAQDLWTERLAIVSPHRAQNAAIRQKLPQALRDGAFVETVDRIQGKERDAVLLSYCVADAEFALAEAEFIFAPERLNVAVTRARTKLIVLISRRLLDAVPADQEVLDKAEILREFVYSCARAGEFEFHTADGQKSSVTVRVRGFADDQELIEILPETEVVEKALEITPSLAAVFQAVQSAALESSFGEATPKAVARKLARSDDVLGDLSALHQLGYVSLKQKNSKHGPFWSAKPFEHPRQVFGADRDTVVARLEEVISQIRRGSFAPFYDQVRDRFAWVGPDGADRLIAVIKVLKSEGFVELGTFNNSITIDWVEQDQVAATEDVPECEIELSDDDFEVLNDLERIEEKRINFGIFEAWTSAATLADHTKRSRSFVTAAIARLAANGWLMLADEGRVRSRMAEMAREVRYVKQRFAREDADERPYLVRSLKVELRDRDKPDRSAVSLRQAVEETAIAVGDEIHAAALRGVGAAFAQVWGSDATIAKFQERALRDMSLAWRGKAGDTFVIAADTGSGKTEAAALPLMAAAAADCLAGIQGVRAVLTYPRVRLAANQAQRLANYLSALAAVPGMPTLTLGLQVAQVPQSFSKLYDSDREAGWASVGHGRYTFPFFSCPVDACGGDLLMEVSGGVDGADRLDCSKCNWTYAGWVGSKEQIRLRPPAFFLPTTDSLHQWLHDPRYGSLFGDLSSHAPPRAILADEIHLYSHIHGAQVGYALRRLAARARINGQSGERVLAIGMSATLGDPAQAWGRLIGREEVQTIRPEAGEKLRSPRGREYFYFVQPEVESRGKDIAGASTTIQSLMCLAHGMRRRTGNEGGFRSLVFLDSIDKVRRLHAAYSDAEEVGRLHRYRTKLFVDEATGTPRDGCCGEPHGCDSFRNGECWYFAATDKRQRRAGGRDRSGQVLKVAERPIFSGTTGKVEAQIKESDVVFSTSSLEVGYDDPNITLVYQHYAPQNLASFIQRKGRGGRGADDRPITGVTLSIYSPRDSWWFRRPHEMIEPTRFDTPMNPNNHFVRRGQILSTVLDAFSREESRSGRKIDPRGPTSEAYAGACNLTQEIFGSEPWREFGGCVSLEELWGEALKRAGGHELGSLPAARNAIDWIPSPLFQTINLPQLSVNKGDGSAPKSEDISLALATAAPGNASRRFDQVGVFWRAPSNGRASWFAAADYEDGVYKEPFGSSGDGWLEHLPSEARPLLGGLSPKLFRPRSITLERVGSMHGVGWSPQWVLNRENTCEKSEQAGTDLRSVQHDSRASLRGFPIIKATPELAKSIAAPGLEPWISTADWFGGDSLGGKVTGLAMARVFWGADAEVKLKGPQEDPVTFSQIFAAPKSDEAMLHGYHVQTEGVRFQLNSERITSFIASESAALENDEQTKRWHTSQMLRYRLESGSQAAGINSYDARRGAELLVSAAGDVDLRKRLTKLLRFWSPEDLAALFEDARAELLSQHPLLSARRVGKVAEALASDKFRALLQDAIAAVSDKVQFDSYLRSTLVHSLAIRLQQSFLRVGLGDERQIILHVRLPVQFGGAGEDVITICEAGAFGDGTTRAFVKNFDESIEHWTHGFIGECPNARNDDAVNRMMELQNRHADWRKLDPNDEPSLAKIASEIGLPEGEALPAAVPRILFGTEAIGSARFYLYDIASDLNLCQTALQSRLRRAPTAWELTSAAVDSAKRDPQSAGGRLLAAYAALDDADFEDSLSPEARLADQIFRIHAKLCVDGCQACLHQSSDMMSDGMVESSSSRRMLQRFIGGSSQ